MVLRKNGWRGVIAAAMVVTAIIPAGCDKRTATSAAAPPDPWNAKLAQYKVDYEANQVKLTEDWRAALRDANAGTLDADRLASDIADLTKQLDDDREKLEDWNRAISDELTRRGGKPVAEGAPNGG